MTPYLQTHCSTVNSFLVNCDRVVFDDQIVIDTGYVGLYIYGIGGGARTDFNKSLINI